MNINHILEQAAALAIGGSVVALVVHYLFRSGQGEQTKPPTTASQSDTKSALDNLRLQAHERMVIYVDRINPANLLPRLFQNGLEVRALQLLATSEIKNEFQHNISQQLYVDANTWEVIRKLKDDTIAMVNTAAAQLPDTAAGLELSKMVLQQMSKIEDNPYELSIGLIKKQIHQLF